MKGYKAKFSTNCNDCARLSEFLTNIRQKHCGIMRPWRKDDPVPPTHSGESIARHQEALGPTRWPPECVTISHIQQ